MADVQCAIYSINELNAYGWSVMPYERAVVIYLDRQFTRYGRYVGIQVRRSTVNSQLHFERHRREREVVFALETLGEVTVAALLELEALQ